MLEIEGVSIRFGDNPEAVSDTTFTVGDGDRLAVVGETGSGKSVLLLAALGLLPASARVTGSIRLNGRELLGCREREFNRIRGKEIAYIPQGSGNGLNPLYTVGHQLCEAIRKHQPCTRREALVQAAALLESFGLEHGAALCRSYPFQLSGGMRQRVLIAMGIAAGADLVLADEPTKGLDRRRIALVEDAFQRLGSVPCSASPTISVLHTPSPPGWWLCTPPSRSRAATAPPFLPSPCTPTPGPCWRLCRRTACAPIWALRRPGRTLTPRASATFTAGAHGARSAAGRRRR